METGNEIFWGFVVFLGSFVFLCGGSYILWMLWGWKLIQKVLFIFTQNTKQISILEYKNVAYYNRNTQEFLEKNLEKTKTSQLGDLKEIFQEHHAEEFVTCLNRLYQKKSCIEATMDLKSELVVSILFNSFRFLGHEFYFVIFEDITVLSDLIENHTTTEHELLLMKQTMEGLPLPVWLRKSDTLDLIYVNQKYANLVDQDVKTILEQQIELGRNHISNQGRGLARRALKSRSSQTESHSISVHGKRILLDFNECRLSKKQDYLYGFAIDLTPLDNIQNQLAKHLAAHDDVLDGMKAAISIYSPHKKLIYYNHSFLRLFSLNVEDVIDQPTYGEILELLRQKRLWPEIINFPLYKREKEEKLSRVVEREDEMLHLPDNRTIQQITVPHPFGGVMMMMEDVTDRLALESNFNTQLEVQAATINNLVNAVSVWGSDGRLKIWNKAFENTWCYTSDIEQVTIHEQMHISKFAKDIYRQWVDGNAANTAQYSMDETIIQILNRDMSNYPLELSDGRIIQMRLVPLPDAQVMLINTDITDTIKVERALEERNAAIERADMLKSQFLSNVSYELRTPITAIQGFASILREQFYGRLNERQLSYVENILDAGEILTQLVKDILDLAVIQADLLRLERAEHCLNDLLFNVVNTLGNEDMSEGQVLQLHMSDDPVDFPCDADYLKRAFENLLHTMINFTKGTRIDIYFDQMENPEHYQIRLQSDWVISDDETRDFIQSRYLSNDYHTLRSGLGLKLSLASSLLELHDGRVVIDVEAESGFNLTVLLKK